MISREDIQNLARLARIGVDEAEVERLGHDLDSVIGYISELNKLSLPEGSLPVSEYRNVMREDVHPYEAGSFTSDLLASAPETKDGTIVVRQIIEK